jgi:hypothetical protein
MTAGENARLTCQVPRTNDFFIRVFLPLTSSRAHGEPIRFQPVAPGFPLSRE